VARKAPKKVDREKRGEGAPPSVHWKDDPWSRKEIEAYKRMPADTGKMRISAPCSEKEIKEEGLLDSEVYARMSPGLQLIFTGMNPEERQSFAARINSRVKNDGPPRGPNGWFVAFQTGLQVRGIDVPDPDVVRYLAKHHVALFNAEQRQDGRAVWEPLENSPVEGVIALMVASFDTRSASQLTKKFNEYTAIVADLVAVAKEWLEAGKNASKQEAVNLEVARRRRISVRKVERARSYFAS
jgi:hypothetical protein